MRRLLLALALVCLPAVAAAQTATPAVEATPAADGSQGRTGQVGDPVAKVHDAPITFEGGAQIGKATDGASLVTFVARGTCTLNVPSLTTDTSTFLGCAAPGAAVGDLVIVKRRETSVNDRALIVASAEASASGRIQFRLTNTGGSTIDAPDTVFDYLVVR